MIIKSTDFAERGWN